MDKLTPRGGFLGCCRCSARPGACSRGRWSASLAASSIAGQRFARQAPSPRNWTIVPALHERHYRPVVASATTSRVSWHAALRVGQRTARGRPTRVGSTTCGPGSSHSLNGSRTPWDSDSNCPEERDRELPRNAVVPATPSDMPLAGRLQHALAGEQEGRGRQRSWPILCRLSQRDRQHVRRAGLHGLLRNATLRSVLGRLQTDHAESSPLDWEPGMAARPSNAKLKPCNDWMILFFVYASKFHFTRSIDLWHLLVCSPFSNFETRHYCFD